MIYDLSSPPLRAPLSDHGETITAHVFRVAGRTLERWGIVSPVVSHKRQPRTADVWAMVLARIPAEDHSAVLAKFSDAFAAEVLERLPVAQAALAEATAS